jgi:hypothetical protein
MSDRWVVNASPLIVFGKIGQLDLLTRLPKEIVVPQAVATEIVAGPENDAARLAVEAKMFHLVEAEEPTPELAAWIWVQGKRLFFPMPLQIPVGQRSLMTAQHENAPSLLVSKLKALWRL